MKPTAAILAIAGACFIVVCGPKTIEKRPVSQEIRFEAIKLMVEGDSLLQEGKEHLAMLKYFEACQVNPYEERAFNKLAVAYSRLGMYDQARRSVKRAIALDRNYSHAYNTRGILFLADDDLKEASKSFRKAIELEPQVSSFYVNLGFAEVRRGNLEEAIRAYQTARELNPDVLANNRFIGLELGGRVDPAVYYEFGLVFARLGQLDLCLLYLKKAISAGFDDFEKLISEPVFQKFKDEKVYQEFVRLHGVVE